MLTKKDYIAIAQILNKNLYKSDGEYRGSLFEDLNIYFKDNNPVFDEIKFKEAVYR